MEPLTTQESVIATRIPPNNVVNTTNDILTFNYTNLTIPTNNANVTDNSSANYAALLIIPIIIMVAMGNILVIISVSLDKKLRSATNCFLSSLAVADLLVALTVMPPSLAMIINNYSWPFSDAVCGMWVMLDVLFSTSSILHLCMISLDRYTALARPFHYRSSGMGAVSRAGLGEFRISIQTKSKKLKRVTTRIVIVWAIALGIAIPIPILGMYDRSNLIVDGMCVINIAEFQIYASLVAFFLPLVIMFIMYTLTIRTLRKQARLVSGMLVHNCKHSPLHTSRKSSHKRRENRQDSAGDDDCSKCVYTAMQFQRLESGTPGEKNAEDAECNSLQSTLLNMKHSSKSTLCDSCTQKRPKAIESRSWITAALRQLESVLKLPGLRINRGSATDTGEQVNQRCSCPQMEKTENSKQTERKIYRFPKKYRSSARRISSSFKNRAMASITNEQRASKVLGLIFVLFCLFWCPFFITNVLSRLCLSCNQALMNELMNWFVWVGYVSSGVNPVVYTMFSRRFRDTFHLLLRGRISEINQHKFIRGPSSHETSAASIRSTTGAGMRHSSKTSIPPVASNSEFRDNRVSSIGSGEDEVWLSNIRSARSMKPTNRRDQIQHHKKSLSEIVPSRKWRSSWRSRSHKEAKTTHGTDECEESKVYTRHEKALDTVKTSRRPYSESDAACTENGRKEHIHFEVMINEAGETSQVATFCNDKTWMAKEDFSSDAMTCSLDSVWSHNSTASSSDKSTNKQEAMHLVIISHNNNTETGNAKHSMAAREVEANAEQIAHCRCVLPECNVASLQNNDYRVTYNKSAKNCDQSTEDEILQTEGIFLNNRQTRFIREDSGVGSLDPNLENIPHTLLSEVVT